MTRGAPVKFELRLTNEESGEPIGEELVNDMALVFYGTGSPETIVKTIKIGDGATKQSDGFFLIEITAEETLLLPRTGTAYLDGFLLPCKEQLVIDFGKIQNSKLHD
jgi:hypothetical protein